MRSIDWFHRLAGLPGFRHAVFVLCVIQKKVRYHPQNRPYTSDIGPLLTIGGLPHPDNSWVNPLQGLQHRLQTQTNPCFGLIVSMIEPHERTGYALCLIGAKRPIQPKEWENFGIEYINCPTQDFTTHIDFEKIFEALCKMHACVCSKKAVYMHCQAGEGRAFILLMSFLGIYGKPLLSNNGEVTFKKFDNYETALADVKKVRPHVTNSEARRAIILDIVTYCLLRLTTAQSAPNASAVFSVS